MQVGQSSALNISDNLKGSKSKYENYASGISEGARKLKEIERRERMEELFLNVSFYVFLASAAYLFLKRFYLNEIVAWVCFFLYEAV